MKKIPSFQIDHTKLKRGLYVSRFDETPNGDFITTFDIRVKEPNKVMMSPKAAHTIEHLGATFLRNHPRWGNRIVYFGVMGCFTGFYLIVQGKLESKDVVSVVQSLFQTVVGWDKPIPGASERECGNYLFHDLEGAKELAIEYLQQVLLNITDELPI